MSLLTRLTQTSKRFGNYASTLSQWKRFSTTTANGEKKASKTFAGVESTPFGKLGNGQDVTMYKIQNNNNMSMEVINYGGCIRSIEVPTNDDCASLTDVVIGLDNIEDYEKFKNSFFGCIVGRYGNRIKDGTFTLNNGRTYQIPLNDGNHSLHGGFNGFHTKLWNVETIDNNNNNNNNNNDKIGIKLNYISADNEEGFPGELDVTVEYLLHLNNNTLEINYFAEFTKSEANKNITETVINLTNHSYFNLLKDNNNNNKYDENSITETHELNMVASDNILKVDKELIPTGHYMKVTDTPDKHGFRMKAFETGFDFYKEYIYIGRNINEIYNEQIVNANGYDHNFIINRSINEINVPIDVAKVRCKESGIIMTVKTTEPGIQFYSGNFLGGSAKGKGYNNGFQRRSAFCLETQHFPDSPNNPHFPSTVLKKGEKYQSTTMYSFENME